MTLALLIQSLIALRLMNVLQLGVDPGFSIGGGSDSYLRVAESIGNVPKMLQYENLHLIKSHFTKKT